MIAVDERFLIAIYCLLASGANAVSHPPGNSNAILGFSCRIVKQTYPTGSPKRLQHDVAFPSLDQSERHMSFAGAGPQADLVPRPPLF